MAELVAALDAFPEARVILTMPNADAGRSAVARLAKAYADAHPSRVRLFTSLGQRNYLSALRQVDVVVGNSSSGLIEAPPLGKPTVNLGQRQRGRLRANTVIDCAEDRTEIEGAVARAMSPEFRALARRAPSPYGTPGKISAAIKTVLAEVPLEALTPKRFVDWTIQA
jgi:UDP-N-acetylglucosamine 2-epimerase